MRKIFVTGGTGGLGTEIVRKHLSMGDRVWALDLRSNPDFDRLAEDARGMLRFVACDISNTPSVREAVLPLLQEIGRLDYIYSCAGVYDFSDKVQLPETDLDRAARMYDINAVGFLRVIQALFPAIQDGTHILCVTSEAGSIGENWRSIEYNYCMSKCAENMACAILQRHFEDAGQNSRVICLHPGWLRDSMGGPETLIRLDESVAPEESAAGIVSIALQIDEIPREARYMDYRRRPYRW